MVNKICRQCGACCRNGGPALHKNDKKILTEGIIQLQDIYTLRAGELVRDNSDEKIIPLPEELVKIAPPANAGPNDWSCRFLTTENKCFIHGAHPAECQALFCGDPSALLAMHNEDRLDRNTILSLLNAPQWLAEAVISHEERCSYAALTELASKLKHDKQAQNALVETVEFDRAYREYMTEKGNVSPELMNFLFGRPLMQTIIMFGIDARKNADGTITLLQINKAVLGV